MNSNLRFSPAVIEFARFIFENPGATRNEILNHLWTKITYDVTDIGSKVLRPVDRARFMKNACGHLFSPYFSHHMARKDGSIRDRNGNVMDWYRTKDEGELFRYWLTPRGLRLLTATPLPASDNRTHKYRDPADYEAEFNITFRGYIWDKDSVTGERIEIANGSGIIGHPEPEIDETIDKTPEVLALSGLEPASKEVQEAARAIVSISVVESDGTKEVPMSSSEQLQEMAREAEFDAAGFIHGFVEGDVYVILEAIAEHPDAAKKIFGEDAANYVLQCLATKDSLCDAASQVEEKALMERKM